MYIYECVYLCIYVLCWYVRVLVSMYVYRQIYIMFALLSLSVSGRDESAYIYELLSNCIIIEFNIWLYCRSFCPVVGVAPTGKAASQPSVSPNGFPDAVDSNN